MARNKILSKMSLKEALLLGVNIFNEMLKSALVSASAGYLA